MRSRIRASVLVLSQAAPVLALVLTLVLSPALSSARASAQDATVGDTAKGGTAAAEAKPPESPKRFYRSPSRQLYVPAGMPLRLTLALASNDAASAQGNAEDTEQAAVTGKEGPSTLEFGDVAVPVIVDGTPPHTVLAIDDPTNVIESGVRIFAPHPKLRLTAADALAGVAQTLISIDGAAFVQLPAGGPLVTAEGVHKLRYYSVDNVGNAEKLQEYSFRVDGTPPKTQLKVTGPRFDARLDARSDAARPDETVGVGAVLSFTAADDYAGVQAIRYRLDDGAEQVYEKAFDLDSMPEGPHHLQYFSQDEVGNAEKPQIFAFVVDRQPPAITVALHGPVQAESGVRYISPDTQIELTSRDAVAGATPLHYRIDGVAASTTYAAPFNLPRTSGVHELRVESEDPVKNLAQTIVADLYVDMTPPQTEIAYSRPFFVQDGDVVLNPRSQIALNSSDFESGVESLTYSLDGGPEQRYSVPFSVAAEGEHTLKVTAVDHVGNREPAEHVRLRIDLGSGPATPAVMDAKRFYLHPKLGLIGPPGLPFVLRMSESPDAGAGNYLISSGPAPTSAPAPVSGPASGPASNPTPGPLTLSTPGENKLKLAISPKAEGFSVLVDVLPPKTDLAIAGAHRFDAGGVTYFGPGLKVTLTSQDAPSGVSSGLWKILYSLQGSPFNTYTAPLNAFLREGQYTLRYYALDNVGNPETAHTLAFTVDNTAPRTRLELSGPHVADTVSRATRVSLVTTDNLSGVAQVHYQIDNGSTVNYSSPFAIGQLSEGQHRMRYSAVDQVGNREEEHTWNFTVKSTVSPATMEVRGRLVEHGDAYYLSPGDEVVLKSSPDDSISYTLDGGAPKIYSAPIPAPESGSHRLSFHAVDNVENVSTSRNVDLIVDRTPPNSHVHFEGPQLTRDSGILIGGATRIVLDAIAGAVGAASMEYSLNGGRWQTYTAPFTIRNSGTFDLAYRATNSLSNLEPIQKQRFTVDSQAPGIDVTFSGPVESSAATVEMLPGTLVFIDAEDVPAGLQKITYKIDDQPELIYRHPLSGFAPSSTHTISIAAEDLLGNRSEKVVHLKVKEVQK